MNLQAILAAISASAAALTPVLPAAALVGIGVTVTNSVVTAIKENGTPVVDENGNPISLEQLEANVLATWDEGIAAAREGSAKAQAELDRTE